MNELVKYHGPERSLTPARRAMDEALEKLRGRGEVVKRQAETRSVTAAAHPDPVFMVGEVVDLPRMCAVHDRPWVARYIAGKDGRFRHAQTIKVTEAMYESQYAESEYQQLAVCSSDLAEECCPWCGGHGVGSVRCAECGEEVCYGRTAGRYFRCRSSCGGEGDMVPEKRMQGGLTPSLSQRGSQSSR